MAQTLPYELIELEETQKPSVPAQTSRGTRNVTNPISIGRGVLRPFVRDGRGDWANSADIALVQADLGQVLGTLASSGSTDGELPWRPEFGSVVQLLRFRNLDEVTAEFARTYVVDAIKNWLFRVRVTDSNVVLDYNRSAVVVSVRYDILATNRRSVIAPGRSASVAVPVGA